MKNRRLRNHLTTAGLVLGCILLAVFFATQIRAVVRTTGQGVLDTQPCILIDPGHGGTDGGASGSDGTLEKDINLSISRPLADMLRLFGYRVEMTRDTDRSIHDDNLKTIKDQKISDMKNRLKLYNQSRLTISIHENQFPQTQYSGTQIFYSTNDADSLALATSVRESVLRLLQPDNTRELKKATKDIYLLHNAKTPAILVECGFLSNAEELAKLKDPIYQQNMAYAIACGVLDFDS